MEATKKQESEAERGAAKIPLKRLVNCKCGGRASTRQAALFGHYVLCMTCHKETIVRGSKQETIDSWNYDGYSR